MVSGAPPLSRDGDGAEAAVRARKSVRLRRTGGSSSVVLPKDWLHDLGITDQVDLVRTDVGIVVTAPEADQSSIEDEPEFAQFLAFLVKDAMTRPDRLGDVGELIAGDEELFRDVPLD